MGFKSSDHRHNAEHDRIADELAGRLSDAELSATIADRSTRVVSDVIASSGAHPNFVPTATPFLTTALAGLPSLLWVSVVDVSVLTGMGGKFLIATSTDHDSSSTVMSYGFTDDPGVAPATMATAVVAGLPAGLTSTETPQLWVDAANGRVLCYFQAMDSLNGNAQDTYIAESTDGLTWAYTGKVPDVPVLWAGDGHGGYLGPLFPCGGAYAAWCLAGGTDLSRNRKLATRDGINFVTIGGPRNNNSVEITGDNDVTFSWISLRPFLWRGQNWAAVRIMPPAAGGVNNGGTTVVVPMNIGWDYPIGKPVPTLISGGESLGYYISSVVYANGKLYGYYRDGDKTQPIKIAIAEA